MERMALILALGSLQEDAAQRGDDRAVALILEAAERLSADGYELARLADRRRHDRERKPARNPRIPRNSTESAESTAAPQGFSPTPPFPNPSESKTTTPREVDPVYAASVENLTAMLTDRLAPDEWPDIDGFLNRRPYDTWKGWIKEMLSVLTGGKATSADLAQVCRDDAALTRQIGSPKGLRTFVASAVEERVHPRTAAPARVGGTANRTYQNGVNALRSLP